MQIDNSNEKSPENPVNVIDKQTTTKGIIKQDLFTKQSIKCLKSSSVKYRSVKCKLGHVTSNLLDGIT